MSPEYQPTRKCRKCGESNPEKLVRFQGRTRTLCKSCAVDIKRIHRQTHSIEPARVDQYIAEHAEELKQRIATRVRIDSESGCWMWQGTKRSGYGQMSLMIDCVEVVVRVPRVIICIYKNQLISNRAIQACHHCDNRPCCNPDHLFPGTNSDNQIDCHNKGRKHVPRGSENYNSKLVEADVPTIRAMFAAGESAKSISKKFGLSDVAINNIKNGKTWRHVP